MTITKVDLVDQLFCVGSPATVREVLADYLEELGPGHDYLVGSFHWGDISHVEALRSLELFAAEVMPALKDAISAPVLR
jgi:alkanesulfonate monooxygenase SsuD/methylene tetrahydromethanopterin reductase-like flavin-dependent oxidoreductase (luciferase family)